MKRFFLVFMVLSLVFTCSLSVLATKESADTGGLSEMQLDEYLTTSGYPQEIIEIFEFEQKKSLYEQEAVYTSHEINYGYLTESGAMQTNDNTIQDLINFSQTLVMSQAPTTVSGLAQALVTYNWTWDYVPLVTSTDKWGIAWTDDWDPIANTAKYSYRAIAESAPGVEIASSSTGNISGYDKFDPGAGIGFAVNLIFAFNQNGVNYGVTKHKGWSEVRLQRPHDGSGRPDSTSAVANYFHRYGTFNGTLEFDKKPKVSISFAWTYDKHRDIGANLTWYHQDNP